MGIFRCFFKTAAIGTAAGTGGALYLNSRSTVTPISPDDALFQSKHFRKLNPLNSATFGDVCTKRVPLRNIDPYLRNEARLTTAFTGGIFGGLGYALQRIILAHLYESPETANQLWTTSQLRQSSYAVGTRITDHFEVLEHSPTRIVTRAAGSPRMPGLRSSDGLFEIGCRVLDGGKEGEDVEFTLKFVAFNSAEKRDEAPMTGFIVPLHVLYSRIMLESATARLTR